MLLLLHVLAIAAAVCCRSGVTHGLLRRNTRQTIYIYTRAKKHQHARMPGTWGKPMGAAATGFVSANLMLTVN